MTTLTIPDPNGNPVRVFVRSSGGYIDAMIRAETKDAWIAEAKAAKLLVDDGQGNFRYVPGASVDEIGPVVLTPAVIGPDMQVTTPAVMDPRYHVNLRLDASLTWQPLALQWTLYGTPDPDPNNHEVAHIVNNVALIDPDTIQQPKRVWL